MALPGLHAHGRQIEREISQTMDILDFARMGVKGSGAFGMGMRIYMHATTTTTTTTTTTAAAI